MSDSGQGTTRRRSRHNMTSVACQECQRRKVKCDGQRPACQRCAGSSISCSYDVDLANTTRYQSLRADNLDIRLKSRRLHELLEVLTDLPTRERDMILTQFRVSKDPDSALASARDALVKGTIVASFCDSNATQCLLSRPTCLCSHLEQLSMDDWQQLHGEYWKHYSADLPFLHGPTFLKTCCERNLSEGLGERNSRCCVCCASVSDESTPLLLAFLALTKRHCHGFDGHPPIQQNSSSGHADSSELYAKSAERHLQEHVAPSITGIQARLILVMYNCSKARCSKALLLLGGATIIARSLNLDREVYILENCSTEHDTAQLHDAKMMASSDGRAQACRMVNNHVMLEEEIRIRTFQSCCILDSHLHMGKDRRRLLQIGALDLQSHPTHDEYWSDSSDRPWMTPLYRTDKGKKVLDDLHFHSPEGRESSRTNPDPSSTTSILFWPCSRRTAPTAPYTEHPEDSCQESPLSLYIKASNLLAQVSSWTLCGGRRIETRHPWEIASRWNLLLRRVLRLNQYIPGHLQPSSSHIRKHVASETSSQVVHLHLALLLCQLLLHWEYLPFLPVNCSKPQGLMDFIDVETQTYNAPAGFWRSSARECFGAAQRILSLSSAWTTANALPLTPFVAYALHTAAFVDSHGYSFPWMCSLAMNPLHTVQVPEEEFTFQQDAKANLTGKLHASGFDELKMFVKLAEGWSETLSSVAEYFEGFKADFKTAKRRERGNAETDHEVVLRDGGRGIGDVEYCSFEKELRDFGSLDV